MKKVTASAGRITEGKPRWALLSKGFAHYPQSFPHRYVNGSPPEKLGNDAKQLFTAKPGEQNG